MIGLIILLLFLFLLGWLLFSPISLVVDTVGGACFLRWKGIASARLLWISDDILLKLRVLFWKKDIYPLHPSSSKQEPEEKKPKTQKKKKKSRLQFRKWMRKGMRVLRSFEVKAFRLNLDTDDYVYNSYLFPLFYFLSKGKRQLSINYRGEAELLLIVENRLYRMLIALLF